LRGSITTTAPALPSIARSATSCTRRSTVGDDLGARMRLGGLDQPHLPAHRIHLETLAAVLAAQELVEQPLEAALAHHVPTAISALLELLVAGFAHVAQQVGGEPAVRIRPLRARPPRSRPAAPASTLPPWRRRPWSGRGAPEPAGSTRATPWPPASTRSAKGNLQHAGQPAQRRVTLDRIALSSREISESVNAGRISTSGAAPCDRTGSRAADREGAGRGCGVSCPTPPGTRPALEHLQVPELAEIKSTAVIAIPDMGEHAATEPGRRPGIAGPPRLPDVRSRVRSRMALRTRPARARGPRQEAPLLRAPAGRTT
jgi:hypothetical protein